MTHEEIFLCPRCKKGMKKIKRDEIILDICGICGGMWIDHDEIPKLVQAANPQDTNTKSTQKKK